MINLFIASQFEADFFLDDYNQVDNNIYEKDHRIIITGIGLVNTAISCTKFFSDYPYSEDDEYINVGIAGAVDSELNLGDVVEAKSFSVFNSTELPESSQYIFSMAYPEINFGDLKIASSTAPVWDEESKKILSQQNVSLVDMEAYAFAKTCMDFEIPFKVLKAVSDKLQKNSQVDFLENAKQAILNLKSSLKII
ncbi:MAG: hypothetical protein NE327_15020 [Lentisphaeraceae bacterium]|nr:hypothetical protein [Lentisphaeraceae bacterium]